MVSHHFAAPLTIRLFSSPSLLFFLCPMFSLHILLANILNRSRQRVLEVAYHIVSRKRLNFNGAFCWLGTSISIFLTSLFPSTREGEGEGDGMSEMRLITDDWERRRLIDWYLYYPCSSGSPHRKGKEANKQRVLRMWGLPCTSLSLFYLYPLFLHSFLSTLPCSF